MRKRTHLEIVRSFRAMGRESDKHDATGLVTCFGSTHVHYLRQGIGPFRTACNQYVKDLQLSYVEAVTCVNCIRVAQGPNRDRIATFDTTLRPVS